MRFCHVGCALSVLMGLGRFADGASVAVSNYVHGGNNFLKVTGTDDDGNAIECPGNVLSPQINLGSISIPGVSRLAYQKSMASEGGAGFVEPAASVGIDPEWLQTHPYLLMKGDTGVNHTGLFAPDFDSTTRDPAVQSRMVRYQKSLVGDASAYSEPGPAEYRYLPTGAVDLRRDGNASAAVFENLNRLYISNGKQDGTTIDLAQQNANYSFGSAYDKLQREYPGMLPRWSPHSPFIDPYDTRKSVLSEKTYRAGRPFYRYGLKQCPGLEEGTDASCCVSFESAMKVGSVDCAATPDGDYCGRDNPVASIVRPGTPRPRLHQGVSSDLRVSWKPLGVHTSFSRAVPDIGSVTCASADAVTKDPAVADLFKSMCGDRSQTQFDFFTASNSPKCKEYSTGSLSDKVVQFLEHFYVALTGRFEEIKHSQRSNSRAWREGKTEYVRSSISTPSQAAAGIKHVLSTVIDTEFDYPPSERWAFVPGPPDIGMSASDSDATAQQTAGTPFFVPVDGQASARGAKANPMFFNDYDTPCTQITGTGYSRAVNGSNEPVGKTSDDVAHTSRCVFRRAGKYEWMVQAMLQSYNRPENTVTSEAWWNLNVKPIASSLDWFATPNVDSDLGQHMWANNRVLFWDLDSTFDAPAYAPSLGTGPASGARDAPIFSDFVRLHTTAPVPAADLVNYTNYRNIRAGLPGANSVVPRINRTVCDAYRTYLTTAGNSLPSPADGGSCDPCWLAGVWQTRTKTDLNTQSTTFPSTPEWKKDCWDSERAKPREVTAAMLWNAWSVGSYNTLWGDLSEEQQIAAVKSHGGTGLRWFGAGKDPAELVRHGTSDGTPRTNVHQSICHVDPFVDTEFLISKPDKDAASGFSTFSAGTLWPADSFRRNGPAEAFQSLGAATDFGNVESPSGSDPGRRSFGVNGGPAEYVERWDIFANTQSFDRFSASDVKEYNAYIGYCKNPLPYLKKTENDPKNLRQFCVTGSISLFACSFKVTTDNFDFKRCYDWAAQTYLPGISTTRGFPQVPFPSFKTQRYQYDQTMNLSAAVHQKYGIHSCADQSNRTFFSPADFGSRGVYVSQQDAPCECCGALGLPPLGPTIPRVSGAGGEEWDMRWTYYRGSGGPVAPEGGEKRRDPFAGTFDGLNANQAVSFSNAEITPLPLSWAPVNPANYKHDDTSSNPVRPVYMVDFTNNVRFFSNLELDTVNIECSGCSTTACCPKQASNDNCRCNPLTQQNNAGEVCTFSPGDNQGCLYFRTERADGAIVVGARAARGGTSPATPPAAFGGIRVPAVNQLFNADFCPFWNRCGTNSTPCQDASPPFFTYGRKGNPQVGDAPNETVGFWYAVDSSAISIGTLASDRKDRCFNALEQGNEGGFLPHCTETAGNIIPSNAGSGVDRDGQCTDSGFEDDQQEINGFFRENWRPPYIHPARSGPELDLTTNCPSNMGTNGPEIRGVDQFSELFDRNLAQRQVGRVSWGARSFGPAVSESGPQNAEFRVPARQYYFSPHEPYAYGKTDGILECASSKDQLSLGQELLVHSILKTADICMVPDNTDDGFTPDEARFAQYRDTLSPCYNPADAAVDFCKGLVGSGDSENPTSTADAVRTCIGLFGTGRQFEVSAEYQAYTTPVNDHGSFPHSCFCTGDEPIVVPEPGDGEDPSAYNSFLSSLCACGALARTAHFIIGTLDATADDNRYDYENPEFLRETDNRVVNNPFCACPGEKTKCRLRHRCHADGIGRSTDTTGAPFSLDSDVDDDQLPDIRNKYEDTVLFEELAHTFVSRPDSTFTDFASVPAATVSVSMPFGASELSHLSECLTRGLGCEVNPASYGDAILTYPVQHHTSPARHDRAIILAPLSTGLCPVVGGTSAAVESLVTGGSAQFSVLKEVMASALAVVPVPCLSIGGQLPGTAPVPSWHIQPGTLSTRVPSPFAQYIANVAPFTDTSTGNCGCLLAWNTTVTNNPSGFTGAFANVAHSGTSPFGALPTESITLDTTASTLKPLSVTEDFVMNGGGKTPDRFSRIVQSCVQLYADILAVNSNIGAELVASSECFAAFSLGNVTVPATGGMEVRIVFPDLDDTDANVCTEDEVDGECELPFAQRVAASGTCVDAGDSTQMFRTSLTEAGTFRVPPACVSQIKYHLFSVPTEYVDMMNRDVPNPIVLRGTAEFAENGADNHPGASAKSPVSMCTLSLDSESLFLGASDSAPMPMLVPVPASFNISVDPFFNGDAGFPFAGQVVAVSAGGAIQDDTPITEPTVGNPCWRSVCADGLGPGGFVVSGAGRTDSPGPLIPTGAEECIPPTSANGPQLTGETCAFFMKDDSNFNAICTEQANAARFLNLDGFGPAPIKALNFPDDPTNAALVAEAPLVAVCHAGMLRRIPRLTGPVFRAKDGAVHTVPPTIAYGRRCALTVRPTAFEEAVPMFKVGGKSFEMVTAAGKFSSTSPEMSVFLADNAGPAQSSVIPLRRLSAPPAGAELVEAHLQHWFSAVLTAPANRHGAGVTLPSVGSGDISKCAKFFNAEQPGAATEPDQADWHACATAFSLFTLRIPTAAWSAWGAVLADAAGRAAAFVDQSESGSGNPAEPVCVAGDDGTTFVSDVFPTATEGDFGVVGRLSMAGRSVATAAAECVDICQITLECVTAAFYSGVDHGGICTLLANNARLVSFSTDKMPTISHQSAVGMPPSTGAWMATCVPTVHPFTTRGQHFGATDASVAALVAATGGAVEPCPATGTALHVGPTGTFCVPTSCDHDTEFTEAANPFLRALHGRCGAGNVEHTVVANLTELIYTPAATESDPVLIWNYVGSEGGDGNPLPTGPISLQINESLKMTFSVQILAPPGAAPYAPGRLSGQIHSINLAVAGSAPKLGMYISNFCNCGLGVPNPSCSVVTPAPDELFLGQSGLSGDYRMDNHTCNPCAPETP